MHCISKSIKRFLGRATRLAASATIVAQLCATGNAIAAGAYPNHAIHLIITGAAGGASDTIGRVIADRLGTVLGQAIVVDNRPGAGTILASQLEAAAAPDGYTLLLITNSHAINAAIRKTLPYDPINDFTEISLLATQPNLIVTTDTLPVHDLASLVALARQQPGKITFGSAGTGSANYMAGELFKSVTGVNLLHVPYKGGTPALVDLMAGRVQVLFFPMIDTASYVKAGKLHALAITSAHRSPQLPDIPTSAEAGVPNVESGAWYGVAGPAKTPPAIVATLNHALLQVLNTPEVQHRLISEGCEIVGSTPEAFNQFMRKDIAQWQTLVRRKPELRVD